MDARARRAGRLAGARATAPRPDREESGGRDARRVRRDAAAPDLPVRVRRGQVLGRDAPSATGGRSACSTARPTPRRSRATATRSSTCTPRRSAWLERYTGIPYPWGKFDFLLVPSFQFGGMEHAGAIFYNAVRPAARRVGDAEPEARPRQRHRARDRAHVVRRSRHDALVQRRVDEGGVRQLHGGEDRQPVVSRRSTTSCGSCYAHYPSAYDVDRTPGTNAIRQPLDNLDEAGSLYGAIIYQKAPIVMRQLERLLGEEPFRDGLREYLQSHAFANATWPDLIALLDGARRKTWRRGAAPGWRKPGARPSRRSCGSPTGASPRSRSRSRDPLPRRGLLWNQQLQVVVGSSQGSAHAAGQAGRPRHGGARGRRSAGARLRAADRRRASATATSCSTTAACAICSRTCPRSRIR